MKLSIISVNYRSWGHLENALDALSEGFPSDWEFIVIDNESDADAFAEFASRYAWVRFTANPSNSGFGFGSSLGAAQATGDKLLFMNPDVIASRESIESLLEEKERFPDIGIIAPRQVDEKGKPQKVFDDFPGVLNQVKLLKSLLRKLLPSLFKDPHAHYDDITFCDWVTGSVLLIDRSDYDAIGGWSTDYWMYAEDADLCRKATDAGLRVAYTPNVEVMHAHGGSSRINVDVRALTKLEVIISKHVYAHNHSRGLRRILMHTMIAATRLPVLLIATLLDLLSLGRVPALRVRTRMFVDLLRYYTGALRRGTWMSPRALANQSA